MGSGYVIHIVTVNGIYNGCSFLLHFLAYFAANKDMNVHSKLFNIFLSNILC